MAPKQRKRDPIRRISVDVEYPRSMTYIAGEPKIQRRRGQRVVTWTQGRHFRTVKGSPIDALTELLTVDFEKDASVLAFAKRWGPFVCTWAADEQWNVGELFEELAWKLDARGATLRRLEPKWGELLHDDISVDAIHERVSSIERSLVMQSAYDWVENADGAERRRSGAALSPSRATRYGGARVALASEPKESLAEPEAFQPGNSERTYRRFLRFQPRGGYGSLEYAAIGLIVLALEHRELRRCAWCGAVYEPRTRHPMARYCTDDCRRLARNYKRSKPT